MTGLPSYAIDFRGHPACPCLAAWLPVYEAELQRRGVLTGPLHIYQLIGGYAGSGGTHADGGAFDILDLPGNVDVAIAREMGADATWARPYNWDGEGGIAHIHGVLRDCPHNGPARYQYDSETFGVDHGRDGLSHGGRGAPDTGPRPLSGRTWQQGIAWARSLQEEHDMTPQQEQLLEQVAGDVADLVKAQARNDKRAAATRERLQKLITQGRATKAELEHLAKALDADD